MSTENVMKFEKMLREDETLQARLDEAAASFAGDKADRQAAFDAVVVPLADELGVPFTYEDACAAVSGREVSDAELDAVAGGRGFCFIIGGSSDVEMQCDNVGGYACAYVGVTG